jgi:hypothetical protein
VTFYPVVDEYSYLPSAERRIAIECAHLGESPEAHGWKRNLINGGTLEK